MLAAERTKQIYQIILQKHLNAKVYLPLAVLQGLPDELCAAPGSLAERNQTHQDCVPHPTSLTHLEEDNPHYQGSSEDSDEESEGGVSGLTPASATMLVHG